MIGVRASARVPTLDTWRARLRTYPDRAALRVARGMALRASQTAPVETGAMSLGVAIQGHGVSDYDNRVAAAQAVRPHVETFPEPPAPAAAGQAAVLSVVTYGALVNDGTIRQAAQPWWDRARVATEAALAAAAAEEWRG